LLNFLTMIKASRKRTEPNTDVKKVKEKHLRDPKPPIEAKRGIWNNVEVNVPQPEPPEDAIKRFGPCQVEMNQAQTAILMLQSKEQHVCSRTFEIADESTVQVLY